MHRILECDATVAVSFFAQPPEHPERQPVTLTKGVYHLGGDRLQYRGDDRPGDRDEGSDLVHDRIALPVLPYFHAKSVT